MVITILQAHVEPDQVATLQGIYHQETASLDAGIIESFLVQHTRETTIWQIITLWESREVLEAMRASGVTPRGVQMFRAAGAEPGLSVLRVEAHATIRPHGMQ